MYTNILVAFVTNMRYAQSRLILFKRKLPLVAWASNNFSLPFCIIKRTFFSKFSLVFLESLVASCYYALVFLRARSGLGETIGGDTPG